MKIKLSPLIYPGVEIEYFIIEGETRKRYSDALVISKDNIIHQWQAYIGIYSQFSKFVYVKSRYGILRGMQTRFNQLGKIDLRYKIDSIFKTDTEALLDYVELTSSNFFKPGIHLEMSLNENNQRIIYEALNDQSGNLAGITDHLDGAEQVECKAADTIIINFDTEYTNNLGVKFQIHCRSLYCNQKWIKYKGKIYRAVSYHSNFFKVLNSSRRYIGIHYLTKSKYIMQTEAYNSAPAKNAQMNMKRIWFLDEQLGGLSVRKYRHLRRRLNKTRKANTSESLMIFKEYDELEQLDDKEYRADPSIHLFMDEILRDITLEEIDGI